MMRFSAPIYQLKRRAKQLARAENIPLHVAQDRIAQAEGFAGWSLLARRYSNDRTQLSLLPGLVAGDMLLIAARPGHGKTSVGLRLLLDAAAEGRRAVLYTLEYCDEEALAHLRGLRGHDSVALPEVVTAEGICAERIIRDLTGAAPGTVAVIDYLQILDQQRSKPPLSQQITALKDFARESGVILGSSRRSTAALIPSASRFRTYLTFGYPTRSRREVFPRRVSCMAGQCVWKTWRDTTIGGARRNSIT